MGDFDVFDEWGNWVGKFTPAGGSLGCAGIIALIIVGLIGFFVYLLIKLIAKGFKAIKEGKPEGLVYLGIAVSPFVLCFILFTVGTVSSIAREITRQEREREINNEISWAIQNPALVISIERIRGGMSESGGSGIKCPGRCQKDTVFGEYRFTNNLKALEVFIKSYEPDRYYCAQTFADPLSIYLEPRQSITAFCVEKRGTTDPHYSLPCISLYGRLPPISGGRLITRLCMEGESGVFR